MGRLRKLFTRKNRVDKQIAKILEPDAKYIVGLFFDLGEQRAVEIPAGEPYVLSISVAYDATEGSTLARQSTEKVALQLRELFDVTYGTPDIATERCKPRRLPGGWGNAGVMLPRTPS